MKQTPDNGESTTTNAPRLSLEEKYPEANEEQGKLLCLLDEIIGQSSVHIAIPSVRENELSMSSSLLNFISTSFFGFPFITFLINASTAIWISYGAPLPESFDDVELDNVLRLYPYVAAMIAFLGSCIPMKGRIATMYNVISSSAKETPNIVENEIDSVAAMVESKIELVNMQLEKVTTAMEPNFKRAKRFEKFLQTKDPTIRVPAPNSIGRDIEGAKEEIHGSTMFVTESLPVEKWIPANLHSYQIDGINHIFSIFVVLQLSSASALLQYFPLDSLKLSNNGQDAKGSFHAPFFRNITSLFTPKNIQSGEQTDHIMERLHALYKEISMMVEKAWPSPIVYALAFWSVSALSISIIYNITSTSKTAKIINQMRSHVNSETHQILRQQGFLFLCKDILSIRMGRVKKGMQVSIQASILFFTLKKYTRYRSNCFLFSINNVPEILSVVRLSFKLDMLIDMADEDAGSENLNTPIVSPTKSMESPSSVRGSIRNFFKSSTSP